MKKSTKLLVIIYTSIFLLLGIFSQTALPIHYHGYYESMPISYSINAEEEQDILLKYIQLDPGQSASKQKKIKAMYSACNGSILKTAIMILRWG